MVVRKSSREACSGQRRDAVVVIESVRRGWPLNGDGGLHTGDGLALEGK